MQIKVLIQKPPKVSQKLALCRVIGSASHCDEGLQTPHSSPLWCVSVDGCFNRIRRTMPTGYRRSGGGKKITKPLSARLPLWMRPAWRTHQHVKYPRREKATTQKIASIMRAASRVKRALRPYFPSRLAFFKLLLFSVSCRRGLSPTECNLSEFREGKWAQKKKPNPQL